MAPSKLGVVMPVFNERAWVQRSIPALETAAGNAGWQLDVIIVDDGSTDGTAEVLDAMADEGRVTVVHQANQGRFEARRAGLALLDTEDTLLIDARVLIDPPALVHVREARLADPGARVWNAHVEVVSAGNPYAAFWSGITKVGWRAYFGRPRHVSFGIEEFDRYPKGTTMFLAPTRLLQEAAEHFESVFADIALASDDTRMLRAVAHQERIHLSPRFSCRYHGRKTFPGWARQSYFRGTTFVDGYLAHRTAATRTAVTLAAAAGTVVAARSPRTAATLAAAGAAALAAATVRSGGTVREATAVAVLALPFSVIFGAGLVRGLCLANRSSPATRSSV